MRVIGEKLDQLESIVSRVLNFAKAPTSLHARHQVAEVVFDTLVLVRLKLAQGDIRVIFEPPAQAIVVEGHKGQLQQVLLNLLINSMQAMPAGGAITIRLAAEGREAGGQAIVEVSDTGSGIPDAIRGRIFDSFLTGRPDGTGLGLAIAKRVLLSHHGDIELVESSPAGTTFRIMIPLVRG
jgi:signal transduction histidine kinase